MPEKSLFLQRFSFHENLKFHTQLSIKNQFYNLVADFVLSAFYRLSLPCTIK